MTMWSSWSTCTYEKQNRTRKCLDVSQDCHNFTTNETRECNSSLCKGTWGPWGNFSECSLTCGSGKRTAKRICSEKICTGSDSKKEDCNIEPCHVDGNFSEWSNWTSCSVSCSQGVRTRERTCTNPSPVNGTECIGNYTDRIVCKEGPCPGTSISEDDDCTSHCYGKNLTCSTELTTLLVEKNINCTNSSRTSWSEDYHPSYNTTSHSCEGYEKINNTKACDKVNISSSNIKRICYCLRPNDVGYGPWSLWGECNVPCGLGTRVRQRICRKEKNCAKEGAQQTENCAADLCPIDGVWGAWESWRECSETCGSYGKRERVRYCINPVPTNGGRECRGYSSETEPCNRELCPIHGNWSDWAMWSMCDKPCNGGKRSRTRLCNNPSPEFGGDICHGESLETSLCNGTNCKDISVDLSLYFTEEEYYPQYKDNTQAKLILQEKIKDNILQLYKNKNMVIIESIEEADDIDANKKKN